MRLADDAFLHGIYEGIFEQPLWSTFLAQLRQRIGADYTTLIFRPLSDDAMVELYSGERPPPHLIRHFEPALTRDPLPYRQMREGRVYALEELIDPASAAHQAFVQDMLLPWGIAHTRTVRVTEPSGIDAWLGCASGRPLSGAVSSLLTSLVPHLRTALRMFIANERERSRSAMTSEAFRRLNFGWLTLDERCRIVDMTPYLEQFFQHSTLLRRGRYDRLTPASPIIDRQLTELVRLFAKDVEARPKAINLSRDPQIDMLIRPVRSDSLSDASPAVAIAYISGDRSSQADRCDQLVDLFGLLPSEARLAWAMTQGMSIAEAATELGLTVETARNYSKKIYAKTGARGQAELVRTILNSVLALS